MSQEIALNIYQIIMIFFSGILCALLVDVESRRMERQQRPAYYKGILVIELSVLICISVGVIRLLKDFTL